MTFFLTAAIFFLAFTSVAWSGNVHKCEFGGVSYKEGDALPTRHLCLSCKCSENFVEPNDVHCDVIDCPDAREKLVKGCMPTYNDTECCPVAWNCDVAPQLEKKCDQRYFKHYSALGCEPVYGESDLECPKRFQCPPPTSLVNSVGCKYHGQLYSLGQDIPTDNPCQVCSCLPKWGEGGALEIVCVGVECPSAFRSSSLNDSCYEVFEKDKCCSTRTECIDTSIVDLKAGPSMPENKATCAHDGKTYHLGQRFYPEPCVECLCGEGWTGEVRSDPNCRQHDCTLERRLGELGQGCLPIYHEEACCPIEYDCGENFQNITTPLATAEEIGSGETCSFKGGHYSIGQVLDIGNPSQCVTCRCTTPPAFTCVHKSCPNPPSEDNCVASYKPGSCCPTYDCSSADPVPITQLSPQHLSPPAQCSPVKCMSGCVEVTVHNSCPFCKCGEALCAPPLCEGAGCRLEVVREGQCPACKCPGGEAKALPSCSPVKCPAHCHHVTPPTGCPMCVCGPICTPPKCTPNCPLKRDVGPGECPFCACADTAGSDLTGAVQCSPVKCPEGCTEKVVDGGCPSCDCSLCAPPKCDPGCRPETAVVAAGRCPGCVCDHDTAALQCSPVKCGPLCHEAFGGEGGCPTCICDPACAPPACAEGCHLEHDPATGPCPHCVCGPSQREDSKEACGFPGTPANGHLKPERSVYSKGELVIYTCRVGYILLGSPISRCTSNGSWSEEIPICDDSMPTLRGAYSTPTVPGHPAELAVDRNTESCAYLKNRKPRWWRTDLEKEEKVLSVAVTMFPSDKHVQFTVFIIEIQDSTAKYKKCASFSGKFDTQTVVLSCGEGKGTKGQKVHLEAHHLTEGLFEICEVEVQVEKGTGYDCGKPSLNLHSIAAEPRNNTVEYDCMRGYELKGRSFRTCLSTGQWSGEPPVCEQRKCPELRCGTNCHQRPGSDGCPTCECGPQCAAPRCADAGCHLEYDRTAGPCPSCVCRDASFMEVQCSPPKCDAGCMIDYSTKPCPSCTCDGGPIGLSGIMCSPPKCDAGCRVDYSTKPCPSCTCDGGPVGLSGIMCSPPKCDAGCRVDYSTKPCPSCTCDGGQTGLSGIMCSPPKCDAGCRVDYSTKPCPSCTCDGGPAGLSGIMCSPPNCDAGCRVDFSTKPCPSCTCDGGPAGLSGIMCSPPKCDAGCRVDYSTKPCPSCACDGGPSGLSGIMCSPPKCEAGCRVDNTAKPCPVCTCVRRLQSISGVMCSPVKCDAGCRVDYSTKPCPSCACGQTSVSGIMCSPPKCDAGCRVDYSTKPCPSCTCDGGPAGLSGIMCSPPKCDAGCRVDYSTKPCPSCTCDGGPAGLSGIMCSPPKCDAGCRVDYSTKPCPSCTCGGDQTSLSVIMCSPVKCDAGCRVDYSTKPCPSCTCGQTSLSGIMCSPPKCDAGCRVDYSTKPCPSCTCDGGPAGLSGIMCSPPKCDAGCRVDYSTKPCPSCTCDGGPAGLSGIMCSPPKCDAGCRVDYSTKPCPSCTCDGGPAGLSGIMCSPPKCDAGCRVDYSSKPCPSCTCDGGLIDFSSLACSPPKCEAGCNIDYSTKPCPSCTCDGTSIGVQPLCTLPVCESHCRLDHSADPCPACVCDRQQRQAFSAFNVFSDPFCARLKCGPGCQRAQTKSGPNERCPGCICQGRSGGVQCAAMQCELPCQFRRFRPEGCPSCVCHQLQMPLVSLPGM